MVIDACTPALGLSISLPMSIVKTTTHNQSQPHNLTITCAGHTVITGGMGALGSLVRAWVHVGTQKHTNSCITLLGRAARLTNPDTQHNLAQAQQVRITPVATLCAPAMTSAGATDP